MYVQGVSFENLLPFLFGSSLVTTASPFYTAIASYPTAPFCVSVAQTGSLVTIASPFYSAIASYLTAPFCVLVAQTGPPW